MLFDGGDNDGGFRDISLIFEVFFHTSYCLRDPILLESPPGFPVSPTSFLHVLYDFSYPNFVFQDLSVVLD